jgi:hypothetical protein
MSIGSQGTVGWTSEKSPGRDEELTEPLRCPNPECHELLRYVLEYVTEQREYHFNLTQNQYVGYSDPVDDTSKLDYVMCPRCLEPLPQSFVQRLSDLFDAFTTSP